MAKLNETKDYGRFELLPFNRNVSKTSNLEASMKEHGFIDAYPLHVVINGSKKLLIKAGHHRFEVARKLGLPIKYVVCDDTATIYELEKASNKWSMRDYLESYCRQGKIDYIKVKEFSDRTKIGVSDCISLMGGQTVGTNNFAIDFKLGKFKLGNQTNASKVEKIVNSLRSLGITFCTNTYFIRAISRIIFIDEIKIDELIHKFSKHLYIVTRQPTVEEYERMIEDVYNRQRSKKIPIKILADELARKRNPANKKKYDGA